MKKLKGIKILLIMSKYLINIFKAICMPWLIIEKDLYDYENALHKKYETVYNTLNTDLNKIINDNHESNYYKQLYEGVINELDDITNKYNLLVLNDEKLQKDCNILTAKNKKLTNKLKRYYKTGKKSVKKLTF